VQIIPLRNEANTEQGQFRSFHTSCCRGVIYASKRDRPARRMKRKPADQPRKNNPIRMHFRIEPSASPKNSDCDSISPEHERGSATRFGGENELIEGLAIRAQNCLLSRRRKILTYSLRRSPEYGMACRSAGRSLVLLAPLVRSDRRMKTGLRKIVFEVCIRVTVIMPGRGGLEKLSCEQTSVAKTKIQS